LTAIKASDAPAAETASTSSGDPGELFFIQYGSAGGELLANVLHTGTTA
jgi:hypothetical protein